MTKVSYPGRKILLYVQRYETAEWGVIVNALGGEKLMTQGLVTSARRRPYARDVDICVRLTDKGREYLESLNHV